MGQCRAASAVLAHDMADTDHPPAAGFPTPSRVGAHLPFPRFVLQPILARIVRKIAAQNPDMFNRLGPYRTASFLIDPVNLPFALLLRPNPDAPEMRAVSRRNPPTHDARIAGKFLNLLELVDAETDGDALFFSRDLEVTGNTEAVVCLRNALDDVDGSIAESVAGMFGPTGRAVLAGLRRAGQKSHAKEG